MLYLSWYRLDDRGVDIHELTEAGLQETGVISESAVLS